MKKKLILSLAALLLAAVTTSLVMPPKKVAANDNSGAAQQAQRKIIVNGQGTVKVKPDVAYVTLGVQTDSKDAKDAQAQNTKLMNSVIDSVKALNIAEKDIKTSGYYMYPQYNYDNKEQKITGYTVTNSVTVTVRNIDTVGDVIDKSLDAGANMVNSIQFNVSDPTQYYQQAIKAAMENAKIKGSTIAESLGVKIDLPLEVVEQSNYYSPTVYGNMNTQASYDSGGGTTIQSGELEISATVQIIYGY